MIKNTDNFAASNSSRQSLDSLVFYNADQAVFSNKERSLAPTMINMGSMHPLPIYYSYCLQRGIINLEHMAKHINNIFNCTITGERGTARSSIVYVIWHLLMNEQYMPSYRIDCSILDQLTFDKIFSYPNAPLRNADAFLFFYELHMMPLELQAQLAEHLKEHNHKCVASLLTTPDAHIKTGNLLPELAQFFTGSSYAMPPLRSNKADIAHICDLLLNYYNTEYGKHIIDFSPQALETLENYSWPGNISQASQILSMLVTQSKEVFISDSLVRYYLYENKSRASMQSFWLSLDFSMTLADINQQIIECVLRQENWNQTKAAKRLGISRSTLWRMLHDNEPAKSDQ